MLREPLPPSFASAWARLNGIELSGVEVSTIPDPRGLCLLATRQLSDAEPILLTVPKGLLLSLDYVWDCAKSDHHLRELLEAVGDGETSRLSARTSRGAILIFLSLQIASESPDVKPRVGVSNPWGQYVKLLPQFFSLPTFWLEEEQSMLQGTTLQAALEAKLKSLTSEFETLCDALKGLSWGKSLLGSREESQILTLEDWKTVDAIYRSRALDLPGTGHAMVPYIDMANHASGDETVALYETDQDGNAILVLRDGKRLERAHEVTISYGDEKGASEMLFSYGFIEPETSSAQEMFLDLDIPDDDPLKKAKKAAFDSAPGFKLSLVDGKPRWDGLFVWLACINEEDGLSMKMLQAVDSEPELAVFWHQGQIHGIKELQDALQNDPMWDLFQLRATAIVQARIESQITGLEQSSDCRWDEVAGNVDLERLEMARQLANLEAHFLLQADEDLEGEKNKLLASPAVQGYFSKLDDFS